MGGGGVILRVVEAAPEPEELVFRTIGRLAPNAVISHFSKGRSSRHFGIGVLGFFRCGEAIHDHLIRVGIWTRRDLIEADRDTTTTPRDQNYTIPRYELTATARRA